MKTQTRAMKCRSPNILWMSSSPRVSNLQSTEPYDGITNPQEHMDAFKSKMTPVGASNPVKCRFFPITLKKATLKWFNSLPPMSINKFSDLASQFGSLHYLQIQAKATSLLGLSQRQGKSLWYFLEHFNALSKVYLTRGKVTIIIYHSKVIYQECKSSPNKSRF